MDIEGRPEGADMHGDDFLHGASVAPGEGPRHRHAVSPEEGKDMAIAGFQVGGAQIQGGVGIVAEGIGACLENQKIGRCRLEKPREIMFQHLKEVGSVRLGRQGDGKVVGAVRMLLFGDLPETDIVPVVVSVDGKLTDPRPILDELGGPVAVMEVEIEHVLLPDREWSEAEVRSRWRRAPREARPVRLVAGEAS